MQKIFYKNLSLVFLCLFIHSILFSQELKPNATQALILGQVTNFKKVPLKNETILFVDTKTKKEYSLLTDAKGGFKILLPVGAVYGLKYKNFTSDVDYTKMEVPKDADATYEVGIQIEPPKEFTLENVLFETGKSSIKSSSFKQLDNLYEVLKAKNTMVVEIQGHTDNVGKPEDNLKLSQERAQSVCDYLIKKGIDTKRLVAKGYGDTRPVADNSTEQGRAKNRRTFLKVLKE